MIKVLVPGAKHQARLALELAEMVRRSPQEAAPKPGAACRPQPARLPPAAALARPLIGGGLFLPHRLQLGELFHGLLAQVAPPLVRTVVGLRFLRVFGRGCAAAQSRPAVGIARSRGPNRRPFRGLAVPRAAA